MLSRTGWMNFAGIMIVAFVSMVVGAALAAAYVQDAARDACPCTQCRTMELQQQMRATDGGGDLRL